MILQLRKSFFTLYCSPVKWGFFIMKNLFDFSEVAMYFFRKPDPNRKSTFNLRVMHGINKVSILIFLICLIVMGVRLFTR